jgi:hypothetical protein
MTEIGFEHWHCDKCGKNYHLSYYCKDCNRQITKYQYENQDELCDLCYDSKEDSEGDGLMSEGDIMFPPEE